MKRFFFAVVAALWLFSSAAWGASVCAEPTTATDDGVHYITTWTWTADADGSFTACAAVFPEAGYSALLYEIVTDPGGTAPTDNYDITLTDSLGNDVAGGALLNRDTANTERAVPLLSTGVEWPAFFTGPLTLNISNNLVNSATGVVYVRWIRKW